MFTPQSQLEDAIAALPITKDQIDELIDLVQIAMDYAEEVGYDNRQ